MQFFPSDAEKKKVDALVQSVISRINVPKAKAKLGGSGAKGTWLAGTHDIDIYVCFDYNAYKNKSDQLSDILQKRLKKCFKKLERLHGSRDYFQIKEDGFTVEIVPILKIANARQAKNITDVSQLHANYVKRNTNEKLRNDIRKAKAFCKAAGVYGAESYIQGFSGYLAELLVIHYGSFGKLAKAAAKWKENKEIGSKKDVARLNPSKKTSPLIVIDPVDSTRNAAAALSKEKFEQLTSACKRYMKRHSEKFFVIPVFSISDIRKKHNAVLAVQVHPGKRDVIGAELRKKFEQIAHQLRYHDFLIRKSGWHWDEKSRKAYFYFQLKENVLPAMRMIRGPPISMHMAALAFRQAHSKAFAKNGRVHAVERRKFRTAQQVLNNFKQPL